MSIEERFNLIGTVVRETEELSSDVFSLSTNSEGIEIQSSTKSEGFSGSNNKQYDHKTWDTITHLDYAELKPGWRIDFKTGGIVVGEGSTHKQWSKGIQTKFVIIGALEPQ